MVMPISLLFIISNTLPLLSLPHVLVQGSHPTDRVILFPSTALALGF